MTQPDDRAERLALEPFREVGLKSGLLRGSLESLTALWKRRETLLLLVRREIKSKYKDSALGLLWSLIRPLVLLAIYWFVIGKLLGVARGVEFYPIYLYAGLSVWSLFQESVSMGTSSIISNAGIVRKTSLPREVFPLTSVGLAIFNFTIQLVILLVVVSLTVGVNWSINFLHFPLGILLILVWAIAFALFLSALNVYYRDIKYLTEVALMVAFYASPIIYPWWFATDGFADSSWAFLEPIYYANPITLAALGVQRVMWNVEVDPAVTPWPSFLAYRMLIALAVGLVFLFFAGRYFDAKQRNFAQEI